MSGFRPSLLNCPGGEVWVADDLDQVEAELGEQGETFSRENPFLYKRNRICSENVLGVSRLELEGAFVPENGTLSLLKFCNNILEIGGQLLDRDGCGH